MIFELKFLTIYELSIPYHVAFSPAKDDKNTPRIFWVNVQTADGSNGFGEFCLNPLSKVSSIESAINFVNQFREQWLDTIHSLDHLFKWIAEHKNLIDSMPELFCAIESAILEVLAKHQKTDVATMLGITGRRHIKEIAILRKTRLEKFMLQLSLYDHHKPDGYKMELDGHLTPDSLKLNFLSNIETRYLGFNANNLWDSADAVAKYINSLPVQPDYVENALNDDNPDSYVKLASMLNSHIVIDESCLVSHNSQLWLENNDNFILNLRVPRAGGIIRTLNLLQHTEKSGCRILIGDTIGETSLSIKTSQLAAHAAQRNLVGHETTYSIYMFNEELYRASISTSSNDLKFNTSGLENGNNISTHIKAIA
ncbi:MAG: enolase C-terminal domain-like protein [Thioalkalispiraceae bacterium]|jgi:L-alanine-DL-glutamate epimerase-like enolase superfamily enzyme